MKHNFSKKRVKSILKRIKWGYFIIKWIFRIYEAYQTVENLIIEIHDII